MFLLLSAMKQNYDYIKDRAHWDWRTILHVHLLQYGSTPKKVTCKWLG